MSAKDKNGLGYDTQLDEMSNKSETDSEISMSVFEVRSSDEEIIPANDRFSKAYGYHVVPPPITGNFLTPRADISFAGKTNEVNIEKPKSVHESVVPKSKINRDKVIIEDWNSDDEDDVSEVNTVNPVKKNETQIVKTQVDKIGQISQKEGIRFKKIKACFVCKSTDHLIKDCDFYAKKSSEPKLKTVVNTDQRVAKPVWDNAKRINHQKISNKLKYPQARRTFIPSGVLTRTGLVNLVRLNGNRAVHTVITARPKGNYMDHESKEKGSFILKKFEYVDPKGISKSVVTWVPKRYKFLLHFMQGNLEIYLQDHAVVDSGCSSHMTGNKSYLSVYDYKDLNGGFVAFGSDPKGG
ncbi:hypothetical protein Tco_1441894 [Tanacetum coccineum]